MKLHAQAERDRALRDLVECVAYFDERTGAMYEPTLPPEVVDPEGDEDAEAPPAILPF